MDSNKKKYILLSCGVLVIIAVICLGLIAITGVGVSLIWPLRQSSASSTEVVSTIIITQEPAVNTFPEEMLDTATTIEDQVQELRGLSATEDFSRELISESDLEETVKNDFFADYSDEEAQQDALVLATLGLLPPDFELKQWYTDLYSEQIAGYYDDEIKTMFVVQDTGFGGYEKLTYAHEYTHVLQDQVYGFDDQLDMSEEACQADSEKCAAIQAVVEGDATVSELLWFQEYGTRQDYDDIMEMYDSYESPVLDSAPPYMEADLYFPYDYGQIFVETFVTDGNYAPLSEVYANLPVSTEQILHPERYPDDTPIPVDLPDMTDVLGEGWTLYDQNVMGEWYTYLILNKAYELSWQLSEPTASAAAEGWGGDAYAVYLNEDTNQVVFIMDTTWDSYAEAEEFATAFRTYADYRWDTADSFILGHYAWDGIDGAVDFFWNGARTVWVIAPNTQIIESLMFELE